MASIRKRNDRYQVQVRRKGFPTLSRSFRRFKDAQEWARHMETLADRRDLPVDKAKLDSISLGELVERYKQEIVPRKRGAEVETIVLNAFLKQPICRKKLADISTSDFAAYRDRRLKEVSPKSLKRQLSPVSNMFELAKTEWNLPIRSNPLHALKLETGDRRRERRLRDGEYERLIAAAQKRKNPYLLPIIDFAIQTAMRRGEILAMRWQDVSNEREEVFIPYAKNGRSRTIPLTREAVSILGKLPNREDRVFPTTPVALRQVWDRTVRSAGINDLHFHDLRHEAISRFFEMGLTVPEVASISGHRDIRMLMRYAHASSSAIRSKLSNHPYPSQSDRYT